MRPARGQRNSQPKVEATGRDLRVRRAGGQLQRHGFRYLDDRNEQELIKFIIKSATGTGRGPRPRTGDQIFLEEEPLPADEEYNETRPTRMRRPRFTEEEVRTVY